MKKEFLDLLYEHKASLFSQIKKLEEQRTGTHVHCEKCNSDSSNTIDAELTAKRVEYLYLNDTLIPTYLKIHSPK